MSSRFGSKLPLRFYADVRLLIPMTHHNDRPKLRGPAKIGTFKTLTTISEKSATSKKFKTGARWKQKDLTAQDGRVILAEYCKQHPPLLQQTGMSSLMRNFYRQDNTDKRAPAFEHGISSIVGFRDASPFLGDLKPGDHLQSLENNMFRAPVYRHKMSETDFLVIRKKETMTRADGGAAAKGGKAKTMTRISIRRIPIAYTVGQLCPKMEVPAPKSKLAQKHVSERLHVFICTALPHRHFVTPRATLMGPRPFLVGSAAPLPVFLTVR